MNTPGLARTAALTLATLLAFAGNSVLCRLALRGEAIDPVRFTTLRLASGALVLLPFLRSGRGGHAEGAGGWNPRAAAALLVYALTFSLAYVSLDAGTGALLLFGLVQVTMIASGLRQGERPGPLRVAGIALATLGVVLLVLPGVSAPDPRGAFLMATAGLAGLLLPLALPSSAAITSTGVLLLGERPTARLFGAGALTPGGIGLAVLARRA